MPESREDVSFFSSSIAVSVSCTIIPDCPFQFEACNLALRRLGYALSVYAGTISLIML